MKKRGTALSILSLLTLAFLSLSGCSRFFPKGKYIVAVSPDNPPMIMLDEEKRIIGFDIDVINEIAVRAGISVKIIPVLRVNLLRGLIDETYAIAISSLTTDEGLFSAESLEIEFSTPYLDIGDVLVVPEDTALAAGLENFANKTVGIKKDSPCRKVISEIGGIEVREYQNIEHAFEDMASNKIQAICADLPTAARFVKLNTEYRGIFRINPAHITSKKYAIAVKKGNRMLLNKIDAAIEKMQKDGYLQKLAARWFFEE